MIPAFDQSLAHNGYAWWYLDAISDDGHYGLTLIAFLGSVFSPYYAWSRKRGRGDPMNHCSINVALYGRQPRWCMTERSQRSVQRSAVALSIGPSKLHWTGEELQINISERAAPIPRSVRGQIRVRPEVVFAKPIELDPNGRHVWTPTWPSARAVVELESPQLTWSGAAYLDHNTGSEPLESCFESWHWARAHTESGPVIIYDTSYRSGRKKSLALRFDSNGNMHEFESPAAAKLPRSLWGVERPTRSDNERATLVSAWEDTPFYTRSHIQTKLLGERVDAVHESLSLKRFSTPWVQSLLPFRMPRRA